LPRPRPPAISSGPDPGVDRRTTDKEDRDRIQSSTPLRPVVNSDDALSCDHRACVTTAPQARCFGILPTGPHAGVAGRHGPAFPRLRALQTGLRPVHPRRRRRLGHGDRSRTSQHPASPARPGPGHGGPRKRTGLDSANRSPYLDLAKVPTEGVFAAAVALAKHGQQHERQRGSIAPRPVRAQSASHISSRALAGREVRCLAGSPPCHAWPIQQQQPEVAPNGAAAGMPNGTAFLPGDGAAGRW
jgi:hypothetical protein